MLSGQLAWAVLHGMDARVELLAEHGVDLDARLDAFGGGGRTAHEAAVVSGQARTAELLLRLGASPATLRDEQRLVAAVLAADRAEAERLVDGGPGLLGRARVERPGLVAWATAHAGTDAVRLATELGWDVNRRARVDVPLDQEWETGLHHAAASGDVGMVRLLLDLGADPTIEDGRFGGTALGWAEHFDQPDTIALLRGISDRSG
jgi:ankyrin repeat protein